MKKYISVLSTFIYQWWLVTMVTVWPCVRIISHYPLLSAIVIPTLFVLNHVQLLSASTFCFQSIHILKSFKITKTGYVIIMLDQNLLTLSDWMGIDIRFPHRICTCWLRITANSPVYYEKWCWNHKLTQWIFTKFHTKRGTSSTTRIY